VLAVAGLVVGIVLVLVVFILAIPNLTESGQVEVQLGPESYDAGPAAERADEIADRGPILLPDVASNDRDIYLQHVGDDPNSGWFVFDAREADASRDCTLEWRGAARTFYDPCDGSSIGETGDGLTQYTVEVTDAGRVVITFRTSDEGG
jgi:hypothetical protein